MANTFTAPFVQTLKANSAVVTAAIGGIGTDSVTGTQLLATGGDNGSLVVKVSAMPRATATANSLVLFVEKAGAPGVYRLVSSALLGAHTLASTTAIPVTDFGITASEPIRLGAGDKLHAGTQVALPAGVVFYAEQGDL